MSLYKLNLDFYVKSALPITKRTGVHINWLQSLLAPLKWQNNNLNEYIVGSTYSIWSASVTYSVGDRVDGTPLNYNFIYESVTASNIGNTLSNLNYWIPVNNNSVGLTERSYFTANKLTFEWALNRYFKTTFRQPAGATAYGTFSAIYITDNIITVPSFLASSNPPLVYPLHNVYTNRSDAFVTTGTSFIGETQYTINVPTASLAIYGSASVKNIADRYNIAPLNYSIVGY